MRSTMINRFALALLLQASFLYAGQSESRSYVSQLLGMTVSYVVILPDSYAQDSAQGKRFPVLYLLHCAGCSDLTWLAANFGNMETLIDSVHCIAVAPSDNDRYGWWLDSPLHPTYAHSRFLVEELKPIIDSSYATLPGRRSTGVAGWSMGGFGALHNIIQHPDVYGSAFSIKGGVDPTLPLNPDWQGNNFGLFFDLGDSPADTVNWNAVNILLNIHRLKTDSVHLGSYGGRNDEWFAVENRRLDTIMTGLSMPHLFLRPTKTTSAFRTPPCSGCSDFLIRYSSIPWPPSSRVQGLTRRHNDRRRLRAPLRGTTSGAAGWRRFL